MLTVSQVARIANVAPNTVRNYVHDCPDLFSDIARGLQGNRRFNDEDVEALCSLVQLRASGLTLTEAAEHLRSNATPLVIDVAATPLQDAASGLQALQALQVPSTALSSVLTRLDALERNQELIRRNDKLQGAMWGAIAALVAGGFVLWVLYLWGG